MGKMNVVLVIKHNGKGSRTGQAATFNDHLLQHICVPISSQHTYEETIVTPNRSAEIQRRIAVGSHLNRRRVRLLVLNDGLKIIAIGFIEPDEFRDRVEHIAALQIEQSVGDHELRIEL